MPGIKDITGQRFGRLVAIEQAGRTTKGSVLWRCVCDCGTECIKDGHSLRAGRKGSHSGTKSCGCLHKETSRETGSRIGTHRLSRTSEYNTWAEMIARCRNENHKDWNYYGGRGIAVCDRWINSFENFLEDMGPRPSPKHSLDRRDNNLGYFPKNCRWVDASTQCTNRRSTRWIIFNGETRSLRQWAKHLGWSDTGLHCRLKRLPLAEALQPKN